MPLTIGSPSPAPLRLAFCACQNRSKTWGSLSAAIPAPVSATQNRTSPSREAAPTVIRPPGVRELDRVADQVLEHLKEPVAISPDVGNGRVHVELETRGTPKKRVAAWVSTASTTSCPAGTRASFDGELACLHARHIEEILDQAIHPGRGALDRFDRLLRSALWFRLRCRRRTDCLHHDGTERIPQVVGDDAEHLITESGSRGPTRR